MAARRGVALTDEHRRRVLDGEVALAGIADELGLSRQSVWEGFRRRGWATVATEDKLQDSPGVGIRRRPTEAPPVPTSGRSAPAAPSLPPTTALAAPAAASAPGKGTFETAGGDDLRSALREEIINIAILGISVARDMLVRPLGATGLRSCMAALATAIDQLDRVGFGLGDDPSAVPPVLIVDQYGENELKAIQAQAEREHRGVVLVDDDDVA